MSSESQHPSSLIQIHRGLYLVANGHGDDRRFADSIRGVWVGLPAADRRLMRNYWQTNSWRSIVDGPSPRIQLLAGWVDWLLGRNFRPRLVRAVGMCRYYGHELLFDSRVVDRLPEQHVRELIAHELGHVVVLARGLTVSGPRAEYATDQVMRGWGFDPFALHLWLLRHVERWTRRGRPVWRPEPLPPEEVTDADLEYLTTFRYRNRNGRLVWSEP
jgi:hypothetical protein